MGRTHLAENVKQVVMLVSPTFIPLDRQAAPDVKLPQKQDQSQV
jgi:hypothetical protein